MRKSFSVMGVRRDVGRCDVSFEASPPFVDLRFDFLTAMSLSLLDLQYYIFKVSIT